MKNYSKNIMPDSLTGAIMAGESIKEAMVVLNGPTGCKFYHSSISQYQIFRMATELDPLRYSEEFFYGQPRVPSSFLDGSDYIHGSRDKLSEVLQVVDKKEYGLIIIVNSPGAQLIGDDLQAVIRENVVATPCLAIEKTDFSADFYVGFQQVFLEIFEFLKPPLKEKKKMKVNLIGISPFHKYYEGSIQELKWLLDLCGIEVNSVISAGTSLQEIKNISEATHNLVIYPECGQKLAGWLENKYDIKTITFPEGPPLGFLAAEAFFQQLKQEMEIDISRAMVVLEKARARVFPYLSRYSSLSGLPKGATFAIVGYPAVVYSLSKFLYKYLAMVPETINFIGSDDYYLPKTIALLEEIGYEDVVRGNVLDSEADLVIADGNTVAQIRLSRENCAAIEMIPPYSGYIDVLGRSILGSQGSLLLVEEILNGLKQSANKRD